MDFMKDELYLETILSSIQAGVIIIDVREA